MKREIALALHEIGAIKFGSLTFKSGIVSPNYVDLRVIISYPKVLKMIARGMEEAVKDLKFDRIAGIPYTALPIATTMSVNKDWPMIYKRREAKDYGTKMAIEGHWEKGQTVLIVDDLITTAGSKFETIEAFESAGLVIKDFVVLVDREQGGRRLLEEKGYRLHSIIGLNEMYDILHAAGKMSDEELKKNKNFLAQSQV